MSPVEDGYDGHWEPRRLAEGGNEDNPSKKEVPMGKWPMDTPPMKSTTMYLNKDGDIYCWTCKECGVSMVTTTYARPEHMCVFRKEEE
jgi:hypothetical protein